MSRHHLDDDKSTARAALLALFFSGKWMITLKSKHFMSCSIPLFLEWTPQQDKSHGFLFVEIHNNDNIFHTCSRQKLLCFAKKQAAKQFSFEKTVIVVYKNRQWLLV